MTLYTQRPLLLTTTTTTTHGTGKKKERRQQLHIAQLETKVYNNYVYKGTEPATPVALAFCV